MANDIWYSIKENRLKQGCIEGFTFNGDNTLYFDQNSMDHFAFLKPIDGVEQGSKWGRMNCNLLSSEEIVCYIYIVATDELNIVTGEGQSIQIDEFLYDTEVKFYKKIALMSKLGAKRFINTGDILLYDLEGRFLFIAFEILGNGKASIGNIRVGVRGDNFMGAFPAVYQDRNSFLHRYLSIFSSIYNDISEQNDKLYEILDLDKCSVEMLEMYGSWFGIDLKGGFLPEDVLRNIVKEAYNLNRMKGTKWVLERLLTIMLGDDAVLYENRLQDGGIFNVTILINRKLTEELRHQIMFILDQFRPIRTRIRLLQMEREAVVDGNSYLDLNAAIPSEKHLVLDEEAMYDGTITLI
ncbi:phage tail protein [Butyrivibrio sp. AE3004]|uniref:phage tail protein n=1 Tax=Butyrivibrio sp. AE3004 TaxID=1506994 RepID=UPI0004940A20|nr:phage tail protein [Butyrivibrio sp. AE3004]